jgi:hypothetical protein
LSHLFAEQAHQQRVGRIVLQPRAGHALDSLTDQGSHDALGFGTVSRAHVVPDFMSEQLHPFRFKNVARPLFHKDVRMKRMAGPSQMNAPLGDVVLAAEADRHIGRRRQHLAFKFSERLKEISLLVIRVPLVDGNHAKRHPAVGFERR